MSETYMQRKEDLQLKVASRINERINSEVELLRLPENMDYMTLLRSGNEEYWNSMLNLIEEIKECIAAIEGSRYAR